MPSATNYQTGFSIIRDCPVCGSRNRVPASRLADTGKCGACKAILPPMERPIEAGTDTFDQIVRQARVPVLVDFWASWCSPCRISAPEVEAVAREMAGRAIVLKVDTERYPELAARFRVEGIPNFVVFRGGKPVLQRAGVTPRAEMRRWLEQVAA